MIDTVTSSTYAPMISSGSSAKPAMASEAIAQDNQVLDKIDLSVFQVTSTDTDAGKEEKDIKSRMSMKDYIAYMLLLLQKLDSLKEPGAQPLNARLENKDEMAAVLDALEPPARS